MLNADAGWVVFVVVAVKGRNVAAVTVFAGSDCWIPASASSININSSVQSLGQPSVSRCRRA